MRYLSIIGLYLLFAVRASATTFDFQFDCIVLNGIQPSIIGTGFFTFSNDPGNGTFAYTSLGTISFSFLFTNGDVFTQADIASDTNEMLVILSTNGSERRLQFSDTGAGAGGLFWGSLDLINGAAALSLEPSFAGLGLDHYLGSPVGNMSSYLALEGVPSAVPDLPSTFSLVCLSIGALGLVSRRFKVMDASKLSQLAHDLPPNL